jgi:hypothetical protein
MESVLAMMVVICGVMLVTTSLAFVGIDLRRGSGENTLQDGCASLADQLLSLGPPFFEGKVLQSSSLGMMNSSFFHANAMVHGYCILLQDIATDSESKVLLRTGELSPENDTRSLSVPMLLSMPDRTVHAAKATVIVWQ